jgi:hypothetical protein
MSKRGRGVDTAARRESAAEVLRPGSTHRELTASPLQPEDPVTLVNFGDWAAQWDELEEAWSVGGLGYGYV